MNGEDCFDELVGLIYEAAIDIDQWQAVLLAISDLFKATGTVLWVHDFENSSVYSEAGVQSLRSASLDQDFIASYIEHYSLTNVWANDELFAEGAVLTSSMVYPDSMLTSTEFYADWLRPQDLFFSMGLIVARNDSLAVALSSLRSKRKGAYSTADMNHYRRLLPHLNRACRINQRFVNERLMAERQLTLGSAAHETSGVCLFGLSVTGAILSANPRGEAMLRESRWLTVRQGILHATDPGKNSKLQSAFRKTLTERRPHNINLAGMASNQHCCLTFMPSPTFDALNLFGQRVSVIALVTDGNGKRIATMQQLMDLFGLTPAEARLVRALVQGDDLADYAEAEGLKITTVRTQLKAAMNKTGANKQKDLVRLVMSIPAVRERR